jgi:hypothetical protein
MCEELLLPLSSRRDHQAFDQVAAISLSRAFPVREVKMVDCNDWIQAMVGIRVIYQVYPRSFQDSDGNGVGDLNGIIDRLSDFVELGVDAIWISPVFRSPMADFGYDISDYIDIDPVFGNMADFYRLVANSHAHGIRVILDFVPNHSSDPHPWFIESRSSRASSKRDWYIWCDPAPAGGPPRHLIKDAALRDNPLNPNYQKGRPDVRRNENLRQKVGIVPLTEAAAGALRLAGPITDARFSKDGCDSVWRRLRARRLSCRRLRGPLQAIGPIGLVGGLLGRGRDGGPDRRKFERQRNRAASRFLEFSAVGELSA